MAGVKSPLLMAPLGTYTGWNVTASGPFKGQMCQFGIAGGRVHSVREDESRAAGKRRSRGSSLEERYRSHDGYVAGRERGRALGGEKRYLRAAGCRRHDQAGRSQQRPSLEFRVQTAYHVS